MNSTNNQWQSAWQQMIRIQQEQLLQTRLTDQVQQQQNNLLKQSLKSPLRKVAAQDEIQKNSLGFRAFGKDAFQRVAQDQAEHLNRSMSNVILKLGKQFEQFGRTGEIQLDKLAISFIDLLTGFQKQSHSSPLTSISNQNAFGSLGNVIGTVLGGIFHQGGVVNKSTSQQPMPSHWFDHAPRLHSGGRIGMGLGPAEFPAILQRGETVLPSPSSTSPPSQTSPKVDVHIHQAPTGARTQSRTTSKGDLRIDVIFDQIEDQLAQRIARGDGLASMIESRYSLSPAPYR